MKELWERALALQAESDKERFETGVWDMVDADLGAGVHSSYPVLWNPEPGEIRYFATEKGAQPYVVTSYEKYHFDERPDDCRIPIGVARFALYGTHTCAARITCFGYVSELDLEGLP